MLTEQCSSWLCAVFLAILAALHPWTLRHSYVFRGAFSYYSRFNLNKNPA